MPSNAATLMPYLRHPSLAAIGDIQLQESDITDADLQYLKGINLRSLDLSKTGITGAGLKYLKPHEKWFSIYLYDCKALDLKYLAHFKDWGKISIGLVPLRMDDRDYSRQEAKLLQDARRIVCGSQTQGNCQVGH